LLGGIHVKRIWSAILVGFLALLLVPGQGSCQFPSGSPGGKSGRGGGMFGDPSKLFDLMSGGKDSVTRETLANPWMAKMFDKTVQDLGITNGVITREQFNAAIQQKMAEKGLSPTGATPGSPSGSPSSGNSSPRGGGSMLTPELMDQYAENMFRRYDTRGSGLLTFDDMPEALRLERDKWDTNKDGFIDLKEFKAWFKARMEQRIMERALEMDTPSTDPGHDDPPEKEEPKPVVYRAGKLPKELPAWFAQIDTDGDGQISLYEWRAAGKSIEEFQKIDRNGDGFLTIAEVLYYVGHKNTLNGVAIVSGAPAPDASKTNGRSA
jgi:Ca2+-binding EF-hand superfamily protein